MEIIFNTAHGQFQIGAPSMQMTLIELCNLNKLPYQSINFYGLNNFEEMFPIDNVFLYSIENLKNTGLKKIILQPNRNINFSSILMKEISTNGYDKEENSTNYVFQSTEFNKLTNIEFTPTKCFDYVFNCVNSFLDSINIDNRKIIVGISGGGDSNTLLKALSQNNKIKKDNIIAVMCSGLDVWDSAIERAEYICSESGIRLNIVNSAEICNIIGKKRSENWDEAFLEIFEDSDIDALGTLIVRKVLQFYVKKYNAQSMITGLNLEDLLAESYFQITKKKLPLPFPIRVIDGIPLWYPLYEVPKKILDGCYPKFSLENYEQRNPDKLINRAIPYYFSQMTASILPGFEFDLLNGFKELSSLNTNPFYYEKELGFSVNEPLSDDLKGKWKYFTIC